MQSEVVALRKQLVSRGVLVTGDGADTTSTGTLISYTCPAGRRAIVRFAGGALISGSATVVLQVEGVAVGLHATSSAGSNAELWIPLKATEVIRWQVTAGSAGTADVVIGIEEFVA